MKQITLLIDANQYLSLFGTVTGRKLLKLLETQKPHLFVSTQIVHEVMRNKLKKSHDFFANAFKELAEAKAPIPDHLLGIDHARLEQLRNTFVDAQIAVSELRELANEILTQISRSEDQVSRRLLKLFQDAAAPSADEIPRARLRRESGNPPGKAEDPLGDQIVWEQLLTRCRNSDRNIVWIISGDKDYGVVSRPKLLLNSFLYRDLVDACGENIELHSFADLSEGLKEFAKSIGVKESRLPTTKEEKQIKEEISFWNRVTSPEHVVTIVDYEMIPASSRSPFDSGKFMGPHQKPLL